MLNGGRVHLGRGLELMKHFPLAPVEEQKVVRCSICHAACTSPQCVCVRDAMVQ